MASRLQQWFPHTTAPFICSAPMFLTASSDLAVAVTKAGGLGFLGVGFDFTADSQHVAALEKEFQSAHSSLHPDKNGALPIGIGLLTFHDSASEMVSRLKPLLEKYKPVCVWLFAPAAGATHFKAIPEFQELGKSWKLKVIVQVGGVAAAREAVQQGCDGLSVQGTDGGGHQTHNGAGVIALVPEVRDLLEREFSDRYVALLAAGGICDGRGVAAALALGADGVVMGTRFVCSEEAMGPRELKDAIVGLEDGGSITSKSLVFDDILFPMIGAAGLRFPEMYDARAVKGEWLSASREESLKNYNAASESGPVPIILA